MTALVEVGRRLPELSLDVERIGASVGADARLMRTFRRFYGLRSVCRAPDEGVREILTAAARSLRGLSGNEHRIRYVIYARTVSIVARADENPVEDVCVALGLTGAVAFTLTQHACAAGLLAVDLAGQLLAADSDPDALALVLTGEKTFTAPLQMIPESTVLAEGTAACLVSADGERDRLLGYATRTYGRYSEEYPPYPLDPGFIKDHNDVLAAVIRDALEVAGLAPGDLALILPHNVNRLSWAGTCRVLDIPLTTVFLDNVPVTGHCFAADPFINYVDAREAGRLRHGDVYVMASVGLGATFSAAVLRH